MSAPRGRGAGLLVLAQGLRGLRQEGEKEINEGPSNGPEGKALLCNRMPTNK